MDFRKYRGIFAGGKTVWREDFSVVVVGGG
jgi:hypothetical protein